MCLVKSRKTTFSCFWVEIVSFHTEQWISLQKLNGISEKTVDKGGKICYTILAYTIMREYTDFVYSFTNSK